MGGFFLTTLITALSVLVVNLIIPGVGISSFAAALLAGVSIGVVNGFVKPIVMILSLPATILTLGFFSLIVNGFCFWLASAFVPGFTVNGFFAFFLGPILLSIVSTLLTNLAIREGIGGSQNLESSQTGEFRQGYVTQETFTRSSEPAKTNVTIDVVPNSD
ncbi:MAG: phage holin family protein [Cyanobacteria bacterium J06627_8]